MAPKPKRKDEKKAREVDEGSRRADEGDEQAVEEYTGYPDREGDPEAEREEDLQPGEIPDREVDRAQRRGNARGAEVQRPRRRP